MNNTVKAASLTRGKPSIWQLFILGALTAFAPISTDMYLPGLPAMSRDLNAPASIATLTVATFFVGVALGQLVYGPLSDRTGRRMPLQLGILLYVAASLGCIFAPSVEALIVLRFLQGLGGCAGIVIARAIVRDRYDAQQTASIYSLLMLVLALGPVLGPSIGALILLIADWRTIFWVLTIFGAACGLAAFLGLEETRPASAAVLARGESPLRSYWSLITRRRILGYTICGALGQAALLTYVANVPDLFIGTYKITPQAFGWIFGINGIGLVAASQLNRVLLRRISYGVILERANVAGLAVALVLVFDAILGLGGIWGIAVPLFFLISNVGFIQANALAGAMAEDPSRTGSTSALFGSSQFTSGAIGAGIAAGFHDGSARPMALVILAAMIIAGVALRTLARPNHP